jgi:hypothetical protein
MQCLLLLLLQGSLPGIRALHSPSYFCPAVASQHLCWLHRLLLLLLWHASLPNIRALNAPCYSGLAV